MLEATKKSIEQQVKDLKTDIEKLRPIFDSPGNICDTILSEGEKVLGDITKIGEKVLGAVAKTGESVVAGTGKGIKDVANSAIDNIVSGGNAIWGAFRGKRSVCDHLDVAKLPEVKISIKDLLLDKLKFNPDMNIQESEVFVII